MLELNNQLSASKNAQQLFASSSQFNLASLNSPTIDDLTTATTMTTTTTQPTIMSPKQQATAPSHANSHKSNLIEDFLQKTIYSNTNGGVKNQQVILTPQNAPSAPSTNSISNIIKSINSRVVKGSETPKSTTKRLQSHHIKEQSSYKHQYEYDDEDNETTTHRTTTTSTTTATSVMQFVDQLLNNSTTGCNNKSLLLTTAATTTNGAEEYDVIGDSSSSSSPSPIESGKLGAAVSAMLSASTSLSSNIDCSSLSSSSAASSTQHQPPRIIQPTSANSSSSTLNQQKRVFLIFSFIFYTTKLN